MNGLATKLARIWQSDRLWAPLLLLYVISFFLPALRSAGAAEDAPGWFAFVVALTGLQIHGQGFRFLPGWLANPLFWAGLVLLGKKKRLGAGLLGLAASFSALSFLTMNDVAHDLFVGYYLWLACMVALAAIGLADSLYRLFSPSRPSNSL